MIELRRDPVFNAELLASGCWVNSKTHPFLEQSVVWKHRDELSAAGTSLACSLVLGGCPHRPGFSLNAESNRAALGAERPVVLDLPLGASRARCCGKAKGTAGHIDTCGPYVGAVPILLSSALCVHPRPETPCPGWCEHRRRLWLFSR